MACHDFFIGPLVIPGNGGLLPDDTRSMTALIKDIREQIVSLGFDISDSRPPLASESAAMDSSQSTSVEKADE